MTTTCGTATKCPLFKTFAGSSVRADAPGPRAPSADMRRGSRAARPRLLTVRLDAAPEAQGICYTSRLHDSALADSAELTLDTRARLCLTTHPKPVGEHSANRNSVIGAEDVCAGHSGLKFKRFKLRFAVAWLVHATPTREGLPPQPLSSFKSVCVKKHK